jgi:eukaryotic-like serine/threonine-protein kinase
MPSPSDTQRLRHLNALLESALSLPPEQRADWLAQLPPQHRALEPDLRAMLERARVETDSFMRRGAFTALDSGLGSTDEAGDVIGPWRLLGELGHGGMSTVWRAERCDGALQREVALKLPHAGWAHGIAQRMARERDILASLEHPRIARLYDAGLTPEGRPWLAMERVEGVPIDRHCSERRLAVFDRLRLFLQVTDAVAHAHCRLVVHRDLKPSNILVTPGGDVRLLDFGVAKLMEADAPAELQLTGQLGRPVTPDYAAPELLGPRTVGTAADVYSLGVVLFELLTGTRPYTLGPRGAASLEDALLRVEVPAASARARDAPTRRALRGDLDTIVAKALRKLPAERYTSVEAMAADLQRHFDGEPVLAQPPSWRYRSGKFLRRHRLGIGVVGAVAASLLVGLGVALWQADVAREQAARAERARQFVASVLKQAQPRQGRGGAVLAADLLVAAGQRIENELADDPRAAAELGLVIGEGLSGLGEPQRGEPALRAAVARAEQVFGRRHALTIHGRALLAESLNVQHPEEAARIADALVPDALAGLPATAADAAFALRSQSFQLAKRNQAEASYAPLKQAIELAEEHLGRDHEQTVVTLGLLANTYGRFNSYALQLATAEDALKRAETGLGTQRPHVSLTAVERWYAEALRNNSRPVDALPILRRVLVDQRRLDGSDTPRVRNAMYQLGIALSESGRLDEGLPLLRETVALEARQNDVDNEDRLTYGATLAGMLGYARHATESRALMDQLRLVDPQLPAGATTRQIARYLRYAQMLALLGEAEAAAERTAHAVKHFGTSVEVLRAEAWAVAAMNARYQSRTDQALSFAQLAWNDAGRTKYRPSGQAVMAAELASVWLDRGEPERARPLVTQALALFEQGQVQPSPRSAPAWIAQARLLLQAGRPAEAHRALEPLIASWQECNPHSAWHGEALHWSSLALGRMGRHDEASRQRRQARALLQTSPLPMLRALAAAPAGR